MVRSRKHTLHFVVSAFLVIVLVSYELFSDKSVTDSGLLKVFEILTSLYLGWFLSKLSAEGEFVESQKKFAISAFRRIKEIEKGITRLINRAQIHDGVRISASDMKIVQEIAHGVRETVRSSIVDWADIIGDEIEKFQEIQKLRYSSMFSTDESGMNEAQENQEIAARVASLPPELKLSAQEIVDEERDINDGFLRLISMSEGKTHMEFEAFWDPRFDRDILDVDVGESLLMKVGNSVDRPNSLLIYDMTGKSIGVVLNRLSNRSYANFVASMSRYFSLPITVKYSKRGEILEADEKDGIDERHYFYFAAEVPKG